VAQKIVVVESPAKAKTINKYLGKDFTVIASVGHIRDLPPKDGSVRPDDDFAMDWELSERASRPVGEISKAVKGADALYLATDPDREGEAIAWHVLEVLRDKGLTKSIPVHRVTFNEITKKTVTDAIANPREIDKDMVEAYMARRALDYLVGFSLSPVLWRKLPGSKSAGRVQSVALRIICERENEIEKFKPQEFWSIEAIFNTANNAAIPARLTHLDGKKLDKFAIQTEAEAQAALSVINQLSWKVAAVEKKQARRNPYPPFTTSTLQQEASRKIGLGATRTMRTAQQLYEGVDIGGDTVGLITYMRTDGVSLSTEAIASARDVIGKEYGKDYLPADARVYKNTSKNAQEAHEAVRPTDMSRKPESVAQYLDQDQLRLYTLIWQRTMASQMASAVLDQVAVDIAGTGTKAVFRATGSVVVFDGWLKVYQESEDDDKKSDDDDGYGNVRLPAVNPNDPLTKKDLKPEQHFTQPPPRFSEASLVKRLEELGIGRPSTYANIMQVLQDRNYVRLDKKRFFPEDRGRIVTAFLENFFGHYVEYDFTADLEEKLDDISGGRIEWKKVLRNFWTDFSAAIDGTKDLKISHVIDALDEALGPHFFPPQADGSDPRLCNACKKGRMGLRLGRHGAFLGCSNYPECRNTKPLAVSGSNNDNAPQMQGPRELGPDPKTQLPVTVRIGPYGPYVQLGPIPGPPPPPPELDENGKPKKKKKKKDDGPKPKRMSLPKGLDPNLIDLATALKLLSLPRDVGEHPETKEMITAGLGRFGPYIKIGPRYKSLTQDDDVLNVGLNRAVVLLAEPVKGGFGRAATPGKPLGEHPDDGKPVTLNTGRFGPYVKWGKVMATVTKSYDSENLNLKDAIEILAAKIAKGGGGKPPRGGGKPSNGSGRESPKGSKKPKAKNVEKTEEDAPKAKKTKAK